MNLGPAVFAATEGIDVVGKCLGRFEDIISLFKSVKWGRISEGISQLLGSMDECTTEAAGIIGKIATEYRRHANSYSDGAREVRRSCNTASSLLHTCLDEIPTTGGNAKVLVDIIPSLLETLSNGIEKFDKTLKEILEGFATTYGDLFKLQVLLEGGLKSVKGTKKRTLKIMLASIGLVIGCMAAGGLVGLFVAGPVGAIVGAGAAACSGAYAGAAVGVAIGTGLVGAHLDKKDVREMIEQNLKGLKEARSKIEILERLINTTQEENSQVSAACDATGILFAVHKKQAGNADSLVSNARALMKTCENYVKTENQLTII